MTHAVVKETIEVVFKRRYKDHFVAFATLADNSKGILIVADGKKFFHSHQICLWDLQFMKKEGLLKCFDELEEAIESVFYAASNSLGHVAQRLEQGTHNPLVAGSSPAVPTNSDRMAYHESGGHQ